MAQIGILATAAPLLRTCERIIDRSPKATELRRGSFGRASRAGIDLLLADRRADQRQHILAGVVRHRLINRSIYYLHDAFPRVAGRLAKLVPIVGPHQAAMRDASTPLILATAHFGPLFFAMLVLEPMLRGRRVVVVLHEDALYLDRVIALIDRLGFEYVIDSQNSVRRLLDALRRDSRTVILFAFDGPTRGRRHVDFFNAKVSTSMSIAYLADLGRARIATTFWLWENARPRMQFVDTIEVNRSLEPLERRQRIVDQLYEALQTLVVRSPEQWSGWDYIARLVVTEPGAAHGGASSVTNVSGSSV